MCVCVALYANTYMHIFIHTSAIVDDTVVMRTSVVGPATVVVSSVVGVVCPSVVGMVDSSVVVGA